MSKPIRNFEDQFVVIQGWMTSRLKLKNHNLICFAVVWGFTQDGESWFQARQSYFKKWTNVHVNTIRLAMQQLVDDGLLVRRYREVSGVQIVDYRPNFAAIQSKIGGTTNLVGGTTKSVGGYHESRGGVPLNQWPYNIEDTNREKTTNNSSGQPSLTDVARELVLFLNECAGRSYSVKAKSASMSAAVSLLKKDVSLEDAKLMVEFKCWEWLEDEKMKVYLRPSTLFKSKGTEYVETALMAKEDPKFAEALKNAKAARDGKNPNQSIGEVSNEFSETIKKW